MIEKHLKRLLADLSLEEKVGQLVQLSGEFFQGEELSIGPSSDLGISPDQALNVGSVLNVMGAKANRVIQDKYLQQSRHKIPLLFMSDVVYGYKTTLPSPMGLGSTWHPDLVERAYQMVAREGSAAGNHVTFSPMVDLVRDPRWGRVLESTGEDSYLNSRYARSMVKGFQNDFLPGSSMAACVKHFAAYGAAEGGRDYNTVDLSRWRLTTDHLPAYKAALDAGAKMIMTSFNTIEGIPATANEWLMNTLLRKQWRFEGVVISDFACVQELVSHGIASDSREASALALKAGVDIDMKSPCYINHACDLVRNGVIDEAVINASVWRVLKLKNELGLFEDPYRGASEDKEESQVLTDENLEIAKKIADESIVLLKNDGVLPINKQLKVGLVGPFADSRLVTGFWAFHTEFSRVTTLLEGMRSQFELIKYAQGIDAVQNPQYFGDLEILNQKMNPKQTAPLLEDALRVASDSDVIVVTLGEHMLSSGEGGSRTSLELEDHQVRFLESMRELNKPIVLVLYAGRPLILDKIHGLVNAIVWAWYPGIKGGQSIAEILSGDINPSGRLSMSFPRNVGQIPVYYNHFKTGRPYRSEGPKDRFVSKYIDAPNAPLYAFGFGLSYHHCDYGLPVLEKDGYTIGQNIRLRVTLKNTKAVSGYETVQVYLHDHCASVVRPVKQLIDFKKVFLEAYETKELIFDLERDTFAFVNKDLELVIEPGRFSLYIGESSETNNHVELSLIEPN